MCNTSTESWAIREGANYYDPPDLAKAAQLRDAAGFGDDNPVTGDILSYSWDLALLTAQAVFAQLQQAGWSGLNFFTGSESAVLDRFFSGKRPRRRHPHLEFAVRPGRNDDPDC